MQQLRQLSWVDLSWLPLKGSCCRCWVRRAILLLGLFAGSAIGGTVYPQMNELLAEEAEPLYTFRSPSARWCGPIHPDVGQSLTRNFCAMALAIVSATKNPGNRRLLGLEVSSDFPS